MFGGATGAGETYSAFPCVMDWSPLWKSESPLLAVSDCPPS